MSPRGLINLSSRFTENKGGTKADADDDLNVCCGILHQKSQKSLLGRHKWKKRYCRIDTNRNTFEFFAKESAKRQAAIIPLLAIDKVHEVAQGKKCSDTRFNMKLLGGRTFYLKAISSAERHRWVLCIKEILKKIKYSSIMDRYREKQYWNVEIALKLMAELDAEKIRQKNGIHDSINEKEYLENQRRSNIVNGVRERLIQEMQESSTSRAAATNGAASIVSKVIKTIKHSQTPIKRENVAKSSSAMPFIEKREHTTSYSADTPKRSAFTKMEQQDKQKDSPHTNASSNLYFPTASTTRISLNTKKGPGHLKHTGKVSLATTDSKMRFRALPDQAVPTSNDILDSTRKEVAQGKSTACRLQLDISSAKLDSVLADCDRLGDDHKMVRMWTSSSSPTDPTKPKNNGKNNEDSNSRSNNNVRKNNTNNDGYDSKFNKTGGVATEAAGIISRPNSDIVVSTISQSPRGYYSDWITDPDSLIAINDNNGVVVISAGTMNAHWSSPDGSSSTRQGYFSDVTLPVANSRYVFSAPIA
mmetsp:Transcript_47824/g.79225  ORF Transcript_47824/g.79225 Transcript_47824/m.79225 type:complete len:531 (-) Transcript_47824:45-1637(-)